MSSFAPPRPEMPIAAGSAGTFPRTERGPAPSPDDVSDSSSTRVPVEDEAAPEKCAPLRIMLVTEPGVNGVFRHVEALAHFLLARGHRIDLVYSDVRGSDRLEELVSAVAAAGGSTLNLATGNLPAPRDLGALFRLRRFVAGSDPDVIHAHSSKAGALVRCLRPLGVRQPLFYTPHAYYGMSAHPGLKTQLFTGIERVLGRVGMTFNLSGCELAYAEKTLRLPRNRLRLIPNPVDTGHFVPASREAKRQLRRELGVPHDALLLGSIGRLSFQKDPVTLYHSLAAASEQAKNLWLYHLGSGELAGDCERLAAALGIRDRIVRRDYLSDPLPFYQAIDAAILTSRYEGLSFAVLEALACELPVILSEAPGNLDFLNLGLSHCWSAPKENPGLMGKAIVKWVADQSTPRPSNHRAIAGNRFSQESCFGAVVAEYRGRLRAQAV